MATNPFQPLSSFQRKLESTPAWMQVSGPRRERAADAYEDAEGRAASGTRRRGGRAASWPISKFKSSALPSPATPAS